MLIGEVMKRSVKIPLITIAAFSWTAHAQTIPPAPASGGHKSKNRTNDTVVVIGRRISERDEVQELVGRITRDVTLDKPIARYADPVCFAVAGLSTAQGVEVADRLAADALEAGVRLAGRVCTPNIFVVFVDDGHKEINQLWRRRPKIFGSYSLSDIKGMMKKPGPAHAVLTKSIRSRDGNPIVEQTLNVPTESKIDLPIRIDIDSSILIINRNALIGLTLRQVADYAAMTTLANIKYDGESIKISIISIFNKNKLGLPSEMTSFDRGYLKAIYSGVGNVRGPIKIGQIARSISKSMDSK